MRYSLAGIVKRSLSIIVLDIRITVSFSHQISDYIEMSIPGVKNSIVIMTSSLLVQLPVREVDNHVYTQAAVE